MPYVPEGIQWYLADLVTEIYIQDAEADQTIIHVNIVLILANSPDDAYGKAVELGKDYEQSYINNDGNEVQISFIGLRDLNVIHDKLEHGAELTYESYDNFHADGAKRMVKEKDGLSVFRD